MRKYHSNFITSMKAFLNVSRAGVLLAVAMLLTAGSASAQVDRSQKPKPAPVPKAAFPPYSETKLKNGMKVIVVEDHKQPVVYFRLMVMSGDAMDGRHVGASSAVADQIVRGTGTMTAAQIAEKTDFYGATIGAGASHDEMNVFTSCLKQHIDKVMPIYADVVRNPAFPTDELEKYRSNALSNLKSAKKQSGEMGRRLGRKLLYGEHPYGAYETEETINALNQNSLIDWHKKNFGSNNAVIAVVGDVTAKEILPTLEKYFGDWKPVNVMKPNFTPLAEIHGTPVYLIDRPGSVQSNIRLVRLGMKRNDPKYDAADFLTAIFCGNGQFGFISRLFQNIREKHGYTYTPGGALTASVDRGTLVAVAEVRNSVTDSALDQMLIEYKRLSSDPVPAEELATAKGAVTGSYLMSLADAGTISSRALNIMRYGLPKDYYKTYASRIANMTSKQLLDVAKAAFPPDDIAIIVTGDAKQIKEKLDRFGKVQVYNSDLVPEGAETAAKYDASDLTLDQVLGKFYSAVGKDAMEKTTDRVQEGTVAIAFNGTSYAGNVKVIEAAPRLKLEHVEIPGVVNQDKVVNGTSVWVKSNGKVQDLPPEMAKKELAGAGYNDEMNFTGPGVKTTLLGKKDGDYILEVDRAAAGTSKLTISSKNWLVSEKSEQGEQGETISKMSDYSATDGVMYPHKIEQSGAQDFTVTITSIKHNTHPDAKMFEK